MQVRALCLLRSVGVAPCRRTQRKPVSCRPAVWTARRSKPESPCTAKTFGSRPASACAAIRCSMCASMHTGSRLGRAHRNAGDRCRAAAAWCSPRSKGEYGNAVVIDHGGGWQTLYSQLSRIDSQRGRLRRVRRAYRQGRLDRPERRSPPAFRGAARWPALDPMSVGAKNEPLDDNSDPQVTLAPSRLRLVIRSRPAAVASLRRRHDAARGRCAQPTISAATCLSRARLRAKPCAPRSRQRDREQQGDHPPDEDHGAHRLELGERGGIGRQHASPPYRARTAARSAGPPAGRWPHARADSGAQSRTRWRATAANSTILTQLSSTPARPPARTGGRGRRSRARRP